MKSYFFLSTLVGLLTLPALALAQTAVGSNGHGDHGGQQVTAPSAPAAMLSHQSLMLGEQTVDGVRAMAHLNDIGAVMAPLGKKENYHLMLMFTEVKTGKAIDQGTVAVRLTPPKAAQPGEAIALMGMDGHFGVDLMLSTKGEYRFQVGSKLADGNKRQFTFHHTVQ